MNRFFPNYDTYRITSPFGPRGSGYHNGIDLVAKGSDGGGRVDQIMAHTGGTVEACSYDSKAGNFVTIRVSDTTVMSYCHFRDKLSWQKGDKIDKGTVLGMMGSTGNSNGAHLHWGIMENGKWIDPAPYLDKDYTAEAAPVRKDFSISMRTLRQGDVGEDVRALQILLKYLGHYDGDVDGIYGPLTAAAVGLFQGKAGLVQDEVAGILTISALWGV